MVVLCFIGPTCLWWGLGKMMMAGWRFVSSCFGVKFSVFCVSMLPTGTLLGTSSLRGLVIELIHLFRQLCVVTLIRCLIEA